MPDRIQALSIRQPWAWLVLHAGKDIENREWGDRYPGMADARRLIGKQFLIHAGKGMTRDEYIDAAQFANSLGAGLPSFEELRRGGIVGRATLAEIVFDRHPSPWFFGPVGLVLRDVTPLPFVPMKGALGFFDVPDVLVPGAQSPGVSLRGRDG